MGTCNNKKTPTNEANKKKKCELEKYFGTEVFKATKWSLKNKNAAMFIKTFLIFFNF